MDMWRDLPQLRDPSRFEAWSYRILVRACHAEGREARRWLTASPSTLAPALGDAFATVVDRDQGGRISHGLETLDTIGR